MPISFSPVRLVYPTLILARFGIYVLDLSWKSDFECRQRVAGFLCGVPRFTGHDILAFVSKEVARKNIRTDTRTYPLVAGTARARSADFFTTDMTVEKVVGLFC